MCIMRHLTHASIAPGASDEDSKLSKAALKKKKAKDKVRPAGAAAKNTRYKRDMDFKRYKVRPACAAAP